MANVTIPFEEVNGSPTESMERGKLSATRTLRCDWSQRKALCDQIMGVDLPIYQFPLAYPGAPFCLAKSISCAAEGELIRSSTADSSNCNSYEKAILTVQFETRNFAMVAGDSTIVEESLDPSAEFANLPHYGLWWDNGTPQTQPLQAEEAPGRIFRKCDLNVTLYNVQRIPSGIVSLAGYINDADIVSPTLGITFGFQTLLFHGGFPSRMITTGGTKGWTISYRFTAAPYPWNWFLKRGTVAPQPIYLTGGADFKPYPQTDFVSNLRYGMK